ncbi:peptidase [Streptomyces sp. MMG1533]|uniref:M48 family metalloprotease n=1 Tax=Streptomyces sp. MMG1533 TaxID=1415546 RepID=UPI0006B000ED|nr:M48 family metallopeptidase [Streptomyces sp. MMG1533]KOU59132.1 peptidase [Streptomyces sp. MMG1533]
MGTTLRALRALLLLAGFYLLGVVLLALLAGGDYLLYLHAPSSVTVKLTIVSVLLAIPLVRGLFMLRTPRDEETAGLPVTEADEPELWRTVRDLAEQVGTRAPSRIVLTADVNAAVSEDARLLGLLPGPRRLYLGVPLLQGLSEAQLRAVLAHELGHYSNSDTRLAALTVRGRAQVLRTITHFEQRADRTAAREQARQEKKNAKAEAKGKQAKEVDTGHAGVTYRAMAKIYIGYAKLYFRATLAVSRRQEYAADAAAARIVGRDATASALREIPVLDAAFGFYMGSYATLGSDKGLLPPHGEVFGGFARMLTARQLELSGLRTDLPTEPLSPYDSHPPIADRVRRIEELPDDGRADEARGAALDLLSAPERTLAALEDAVLTDEVRRFGRTRDWQELLDRSMAEALAADGTPLHGALRQYTQEQPTLPALLDVIEDGRLWQLAKRLPLSEEAAASEGRVFREFVRPTLHKSLISMALAELNARSLLRWEFSWERSAIPHLPPASDGTETDLDAVVGSAVADAPDTAPLRALLTHHDRSTEV